MNYVSFYLIALSHVVDQENWINGMTIHAGHFTPSSWTLQLHENLPLQFQNTFCSTVKL